MAVILRAAFQEQPLPSPPAELSSGQLELGVAVLLVGLVITVVFAAFLGFGLSRFYEVFKATVTPGQQFETGPVPPTVRGQGIVAEEATGISIDGPPNVEVGSAATFRVTRADGSKLTGKADWRIQPADAATITSTGDDVAQVQASKAVQFRVIATVKEDQGGKPTTLMASANVQARPKASAAGRVLLPFVGTGYVTLLVLPLLVSVVALLGITGALNGEALAAFFSAVGGFLFGHAVAAAGGSGSKDSQQS